MYLTIGKKTIKVICWHPDSKQISFRGVTKYGREFGPIETTSTYKIYKEMLKFKRGAKAEEFHTGINQITWETPPPRIYKKRGQG
jgi:hypothetical protein